MTTRSWIDIEEFGDKSYLVQYTSVDTHEDATFSSFFLLRLASEQELEEHSNKLIQRRRLEQD